MMNPTSEPSAGAGRAVTFEWQPAVIDELPVSARRVMRAAERLGATVESRRASGVLGPPFTRKPRRVDSVALRARNDKLKIDAVWHNGKFDVATIHTRKGGTWCRKLTDLMALLRVLEECK